MGIFADIASLVIKGVKSIPKILTSVGAGVVSAVDAWRTYGYNDPRLFNSGNSDEVDEEKQLRQVLDDKLSKRDANTFLNTISNLVSLQKDAQDKSPECQCKYVLNQESKIKELEKGTINVAISSSSNANDQASKQNSWVYNCPLVSNLGIQVNSVPTDANISVSKVIIPQNPDDINSYVKLDSETLNQNNTSTSTNMELDGAVFQISTIENELIPLLKLKYNYKDNEVDEFIKKISLIWGNHKGIKAFIKKVLKSIKANILDTVRSNSENSVKIDTNPDGTLDVTNYVEDEVDCIQVGTTGYLIEPKQDCSITMKQETGSLVVENQGFPFEKVLSENIEFKREKVRFSFIKKSELLQLAKLYIEKDITFDKILLKLCYKYRHTSGLHAVFKKGELNRFVSSEQLNDLDEDEEYEENNFRLFFI